MTHTQMCSTLVLSTEAWSNHPSHTYTHRRYSHTLFTHTHTYTHIHTSICLPLPYAQNTADDVASLPPGAQAVFDFQSLIPKQHLAQAASRCGAHARALQYYESYVRRCVCCVYLRRCECRVFVCRCVFVCLCAGLCVVCLCVCRVFMRSCVCCVFACVCVCL